MKLPTFSELTPALLMRARAAASEQAFLDVEPPPGFLAAYVRPGQFCKIRIGDVEGLFAMFSAPPSAARHGEGARSGSAGRAGGGEALSDNNAQPLRFLVRVGNPDHGEAADAMAGAPDGTPILMSLPAGEGFPIERARGRDVYFVATGTGIAPVRAAIEVLLAEREAYGAITLDHGLRSAGHLAIGEDVSRWSTRGVDVHVHLSTPDQHGVHGVTVQSALRARRPNLHGAAVVAVGQTEMLAGLLEDAVALGLEASHFLTNV